MNPVTDVTRKAFISYARDDRPIVDVLLKGLRSHGSDFQWKLWEDTQIPIGARWHDSIQQKIQDCDFALLLVSANFLSSEYIRKYELNEFLIRDNTGQFPIFPILLAPCNLEKNEELTRRQFFRCHGKDYGRPNIQNLSYLDLIDYNKYDGTIFPSAARERYHMNLIIKIEEALQARI